MKAILLAAGLSKRMGVQKLLLPFGESTRGREWGGHDAGKRVSWVGGNEVPPSRPFGAPSPAASHAGEGRNEEGCRKARQLGGRG